jgi:uncharacterized SAM-binding protein YcdF (DUF218 family)
MKAILSIIISLIVLIFGLSVYLQPNSLSSCSTSKVPSSQRNCQSAGAIVAVSGGDTETRTRHAIELYKNSWAPLIVFSGAAQDASGPSNAVSMQQKALNSGVPATAILVEELSNNTQENAANTKEILVSRGVSSIILVTSGYHQRRTYLEFSKTLEGTGIIILNSPTNDLDWSWCWWLTPRGWYLTGSEIVKIIAFYIETIR